VGPLVPGQLVGEVSEVARGKRDLPTAGHGAEGSTSRHLSIGQALADRGTEIEFGAQILEVQREIRDVEVRQSLCLDRRDARPEQRGPDGAEAQRLNEGVPTLSTSSVLADWVTTLV
jgi:hypothetical protein